MSDLPVWFGTVLGKWEELNPSASQGIAET